MSSLLIVGSLAFDTIETPTGWADRALGGSALYASATAGIFCSVHLVSVIGEDLAIEELSFLESRRVDLSGVTVASGKTFHWSGAYEANLNNRRTLSTDLNVFADFSPQLPLDYRNDQMVFLANIDPSLQLDVLGQIDGTPFVALDTMNMWIETAGEPLQNVLSQTDLVILNDEEAELLSGTRNILTSARAISDMGPSAVIIKKGEHGAFLWADGQMFSVPALPLETMVDPTGAGDSFAGGMMGYLTQAGDTSIDTLKRAIVYGTAAASLTVEAFSVEGLRRADRDKFNSRYRALHALTSFDPVLREV
ncbi:MAG: PfkB family carbohydrate kinase [Candidatus Latescibacteria bacterium]|nr:PfkB family carbohydrate kinase [Candidatus Latescibacterota bacterium]